MWQPIEKFGNFLFVGAFSRLESVVRVVYSMRTTAQLDDEEIRMSLRWLHKAGASFFLAASVLGAILWSASPVAAFDCVNLLPVFQQGGNDVDVASATGLSVGTVSQCRAELSRPIYIGPAGPPTSNAVGQSPVGAVGRPPVNAVGPPPVGAVGPPPGGRDVRRLP